MNKSFLYPAFFIINAIISSINGLPIIELGPAIVVKQNKPIIYSPQNETIIVPPPPQPAPLGPLLTNKYNDIMPAKFITMDGIVIYTPKDATPFILPIEK
jgi:hypothetical protein